MDGVTILLLAIIVGEYVYFKNKVNVLVKDVNYWRQGYTEVNTKLNNKQSRRAK